LNKWRFNRINAKHRNQVSAFGLGVKISVKQLPFWIHVTSQPFWYHAPVILNQEPSKIGERLDDAAPYRALKVRNTHGD